MVKLLSTKFELLSGLKGKFIACHRFECFISYWKSAINLVNKCRECTERMHLEGSFSEIHPMVIRDRWRICVLNVSFLVLVLYFLVWLLSSCYFCGWLLQDCSTFHVQCSLYNLRSLLKKWLVIFELSFLILLSVMPCGCLLMGVWSHPSALKVLPTPLLYMPDRKMILQIKKTNCWSPQRKTFSSEIRTV